MGRELMDRHRWFMVGEEKIPWSNGHRVVMDGTRIFMDRRRWFIDREQEFVRRRLPYFRYVPQMG